MRFWDAVAKLQGAGRYDLAEAATRYYDQQVHGLSTTARVNTACMFDEILTKELYSPGETTYIDILISQDFAFLRALAQALKVLGLDDLGIEITLTEEEISA